MINSQKYWAELEDKYNYLLHLLSKLNITPKEGHGLYSMLEIVNALLNCEKSKIENEEEIKKAILHDAKSCQALYALTESLKTLDQYSIEYKYQLNNCRTGSFDYGKHDEDSKMIFYKDFEYELFLAASIVKTNCHNVKLPQDSGPIDLFIDSKIPLQAKHPSNMSNISEYLKKYDTALQERNLYGLVGIALEDAFNLGDQISFDTEEDWIKYFNFKNDLIETQGMKYINSFNQYKMIAGYIMTSTYFRSIGGCFDLKRYSNAFFPNEKTSIPEFETIGKILQVFNPTYHL